MLLYMAQSDQAQLKYVWSSLQGTSNEVHIKRALYTHSEWMCTHETCHLQPFT